MLIGSPSTSSEGVGHLAREGTAIILCGGKSRRMGFDKSRITIDGMPLIKIIHENLMKEFNEVILVADNKEKFLNSDYKVVEDIYKGCGPLGAIYTGLMNSSQDYIFVFACDMPFISKAYINYMKEIMKKQNPDCVVTLKNGFIEPFYSLINKNAASIIEKSIICGNYKINEVIKACDSYFIDENTMKEFTREVDIFTNLNYTEELKILSRYGIEELMF